MNRRGFLKRCSLIPFAGSLAFTSKSGASKAKSGLSLAELMVCKDELDARRISEDFLIPVDKTLYSNYDLCDSTAIWAKAMAWAKKENEIILNCINI